MFDVLDGAIEDLVLMTDGDTKKMDAFLNGKPIEDKEKEEKTNTEIKTNSEEDKENDEKGV